MKRIDKILKAALICPTILSVVSCKEPEQDLFDLEKQIEERIEQDVFKFMDKKPLTEIKGFHLFDLKYIDITNENNVISAEKCLILSGDMITADYAGRVKGVVKYQVSRQCYELAQEIKETSSQVEKDKYFNENYAFQRYGQSIIILKQILDDPFTRLDSVYDADNKYFLYNNTSGGSVWASNTQDKTGKEYREI